MTVSAWVAIESGSSSVDCPDRLTTPCLSLPVAHPPLCPHVCCCPAGLHRCLHSAAVCGEVPDAARGGASPLAACLPACPPACLPVLCTCTAGASTAAPPAAELPAHLRLTRRSTCKRSSLEASSWRRFSSPCPSGLRCTRSTRRPSRAWWVGTAWHGTAWQVAAWLHAFLHFGFPA